MAHKKKEPNRVDIAVPACVRCSQALTFNSLAWRVAPHANENRYSLLDELLEDCATPEDILGKSGLMGQIKKRLVERALGGELNHHLNIEPAEEGTRPNSRNGSSKKTVQSTDGELELSIPRDRNGSFEPILMPKPQRRIAGLDEKILALYARGTSKRDISAQLSELYAFELLAITTHLEPAQTKMKKPS